MSNTTRWIFMEKQNTKTNEKDQNISIEKIGAKIEEVKNNTSVLADKQNTISKVEVNTAFPKFKKETFGSNQINFNFYNISYYRTSNIDNTSTEDNFWIILYTLNQKKYLIINKNSGALTLLRKIFGFKGRNEIAQVPHGIDSRIIIWLISMVYNSSADYTNSDKILSIDSINGFKGNTEDLLNTVSADGSGIMNILSTLSFLLESSSLRQIRLTLSFGEHKNLELKIDVNNTIESNEDKYRGIFLIDEESTTDSVIYNQYLLIYNEIIPLIRQWFNESQDDEEENLTEEGWWKKFYKNFLIQVSDDLKNKVDEKRKRL